LALVVAVGTADGDGNSGQNRVSGGRVATVAMAVADNNRNCRGRQQSTKCSRGSNGNSGRGSSNHGSMAMMAGRGSGVAEVT
jgi:hypothetical protein